MSWGRRPAGRLTRTAWLAGALLASAGLAVEPAGFVPGDVIVKFKDASAAGGAVVRAMRSDRPTREVEELATRLSTELRVPITAARVTSGRELVLSIDRAALMQSLSHRLRRDPDVRRVVPLDAAKTVLPATQAALVVDIADDSAAREPLRQAARSAAGRTAETDALVARLVAGGEPLPTGRVNEQEQLVLTVDVAVLTRELVDRLQRRVDVEYAQLSHVVRPFGGPSP